MIEYSSFLFNGAKSETFRMVYIVIQTANSKKKLPSYENSISSFYLSLRPCKESYFVPMCRINFSLYGGLVCLHHPSSVETPLIYSC